MYKNIIFDLGGVVVDFNPRDFLMDYFMNKSAEDAVYDLTFGSKEWEDLDRGDITRAAANRIMLENAANCGRTFEVQTVIDEWEKILRTKKTTIKTMCKLKMAGYRLYYLSNIASDTLDLIKQRDFFPLFDGGIASCEVPCWDKRVPQDLHPVDAEIPPCLRRIHFCRRQQAKCPGRLQDLGITGILYKNKKSFNRALGLCGIHLTNRRAPAPVSQQEQ